MKVFTLTYEEAMDEIDAGLAEGIKPWDLLPEIENPSKMLRKARRELASRTAFGISPIPPEGPHDPDYIDEP